MPRSVWIIAGVVTLALAAATLMLVPWARILIVAPLLLYLPGLLVGGGFFPRLSLFSIELTVMAIALSIAIAILGGLALAMLPWGLSAPAWPAYYAVVALLAVGIAWVGRGASWPRQLPFMNRAGGEPHPWAAPILALAGVVALAALVVASVASATDREAFTELYVAHVGSAAAPAVRITVTSHEPRPLHYQVVVTNRGKTIHRFADLRIDPGASWQGTLRLAKSPGTAILVVNLFRTDLGGTTPYRSLSVSAAWAQGQP